MKFIFVSLKVSSAGNSIQTHIATYLHNLCLYDLHNLYLRLQYLNNYTVIVGLNWNNGPEETVSNH